ncbi:MAG TPA: DoxX family protein [Capsulimonadaceae bacterium]|nr:DoxX family protein [Capsulimonadaceae bacterium]
MQSTAQTQAASSPKGMLWTGYIISVLVVLFMLMDTTMHIAKPPQVVDAFAKLGYPIGLALTLGVIELVSTVLYAIPRTSVFGAILLTAYLGGATASQVRIDGSYWFSIAFGMLVWLGLYLRDEKLRALVPLRS